jgi:hypothetical protein
MVAHPLDPLSPTEYQQTAAVLRRDQGVGNAWRFASIELKKPAKIDVKAWRAGDAVPRRSFSGSGTPKPITEIFGPVMMPPYGPQFGPDFIFLGAAGCDL